MIDTAFLIAGLVLLYFGAEWLVGGAARLAQSFGVRPLLVGLTVVAYGTSSPELVVGISAAAAGRGELAIGNVIGSNVANIGLILAVAALIRPTTIDRSLRRRELPVLVISAGLVPLVLVNSVIERWEGIALLSLALAYTAWMIRANRADPTTVSDVTELAAAADAATLGAIPQTGRLRLAGLAALGLGLLIGGGHLLVEGAVGLARLLGMEERLIGLTIVAVGTSLPELATSVIAAIRGHSDIAIGNVVGSNIFNVLLILGTAGVVAPISGDLGTLARELVALAVLTSLAAVAIATRTRVSRLEALVLLLGYVGFLISLALSVPD